MRTRMERIGAALLALCMMVLLAPVPGARADDAGITLSFSAPESWDDTDTYTVQILASVPGTSFDMYSGQISLLFDPAVLTLAEASTADIEGLSGTANTFSAGDGYVSFDYLPADLASLDNVTVPDGQVLGTATFSPASDDARGSSTDLSFAETAARPTEISYTNASGYQAYTMDASATWTVPPRTPPAPDTHEYAVSISGPDTVSAGSTGTYTASVTVDGTADPSLTAVISMDDRTDGIVLADGVLTVPADLSADASVVLTATYTPDDGEAVTDTKTVSVTAAAPVTHTYAVSISGPDTVAAGSTGTYTASVTVDGAADPDLTAVISMDDRTDGITFADGVLTVPADLSADASVVLTATYTPDDGEAVTATKTVSATAPSVVRYAVEVSGGTGAGTYAPGDLVTIAADPATDDGRPFRDWAWSGPDGFVLDESSRTVTFTMPEGDVSALARYRSPGGCYVATSVYGSYDCPEVWTLRRFRDEVLAESWYGRLFIRAYYAVSPTMVELFGDTDWFQDLFRDRLDGMVSSLQEDGFASTPYEDPVW